MGVSDVKFSPCGKFVCSGNYDTFAKMWDVETATEVKKMSGHRKKLCSVSFSPNGKFIATGGADMSVNIYDVNSGELYVSFKGHKDVVRSVSFSPCGTASADNNREIKFWSFN